MKSQSTNTTRKLSRRQFLMLVPACSLLLAGCKASGTSSRERGIDTKATRTPSSQTSGSQGNQGSQGKKGKKGKKGKR